MDSWRNLFVRVAFDLKDAKAVMKEEMRRCISSSTLKPSSETGSKDSKGEKQVGKKRKWDTFVLDYSTPQSSS